MALHTHIVTFLFYFIFYWQNESPIATASKGHKLNKTIVNNIELSYYNFIRLQSNLFILFYCIIMTKHSFEMLEKFEIWTSLYLKKLATKKIIEKSNYKIMVVVKKSIATTVTLQRASNSYD